MSQVCHKYGTSMSHCHKYGRYVCVVILGRPQLPNQLPAPKSHLPATRPLSVPFLIRTSGKSHSQAGSARQNCIIKQTEKYHVTSAEAWPGRSLLWEWLSGDYLRWVELSGGRRVSRCPPWLSIVNNVSAPPLTIIILRVTLITVRLLTMMVHIIYFTFCDINTTLALGARSTHATHKILGSKWNDERSYSGIHSPTTHSLPTGILVDRATWLKTLGNFIENIRQHHWKY